MEMRYYQKFHHVISMPFFENFAPPLTQSQLRHWSYSTILTPRPHFLEQNNQEQNDATAANAEAITTYCSRTILLPQQTKTFMPSLTLKTNFVKKDVIFCLPWESNMSYQFTFLQFQLVHHVCLVIAQLSTFIKLLVYCCNNPSDISVPWNCGSVLKSYTHHPQ